ncbi:hypothetical protein C4577_01405 [Candidatus Parcubacteria bacterium]|nr:MAG: hypothetical protein C4577_01405 [Candidatus Parcubacteria bacterium]
MKKNIWQRRIPTIIGLTLVIVGIWASSSLIQKSLDYVTRAGPDSNPQNITISDVNDTSFTVSFFTTGKTKAIVNYGENKELGTLAYDNRDKSGEQNPYYSHNITASNLKPGIKYYFSIIVDGNIILNNNEPFEIQTGLEASSPPFENYPIFGKVIFSDGTEAEDVLVIMKAKDVQTVSTLTKKNGEYIIPLNSARKQDLGAYYEFSPDTNIDIEFYKGSSKSTVSVLYKNAKSVPLVTLSKDYNFENEDLAPEIESTISSALKAPSAVISSKEVKILTPKEDEAFIDQKPTFKGYALPNEKVKITIRSEDPITTEVKTDSKGFWSFRPIAGLAPGEHTITIETIDEFGIIKKITQSFIVHASGTQVTESATPSATPTVKPTITLTPTPTSAPTPTTKPTTSPTLTPTDKPSVVSPTIRPTEDVSAIQEISPTSIETISIEPTTKPTVPIKNLTTTIASPGDTVTPATLTFISTLFILAGAALFLVF